MRFSSRHQLPRRQMWMVVCAALFWLHTGTAPAAAQTAADRTRILALANRGAAAEAWSAWTALPNTQARTRFGIEIAIALKDLPRGVGLYDALVKATGRPDPTSLKALAIAAAAELMGGRDTSAGLTACSAALRLAPTTKACRDPLERMASLGTTTAEQAVGAYALADAGLRPFPGLFTTLEQTLSTSARLTFVLQFPHLPAAERVSMLRPVAESPDANERYQAVLLLADMPEPEALARLRTIDPSTTALRQAIAVALAAHGDDASLDTVRATLDNLGDYLKIPGAAALARSGDPQGAATLNTLMASPIDLQRLQAADAATRLSRSAGQDTILATLTKGSPAIRSLALAAAGRAGLGTDAAVYTRLVGPEPEVRAQAVAAVAETLLLPALPAAPEGSTPDIAPPRP